MFLLLAGETLSGGPLARRSPPTLPRLHEGPLPVGHLAGLWLTGAAGASVLLQSIALLPAGTPAPEERRCRYRSSSPRPSSRSTASSSRTSSSSPAATTACCSSRRTPRRAGPAQRGEPPGARPDAQDRRRGPGERDPHPHRHRRGVHDGLGPGGFALEEADLEYWAYEYAYKDGRINVSALVNDLEIPTIGLLNGPGSTPRSLLMCDITLAAEDATIFDLHYDIGSVPARRHPQLLPGTARRQARRVRAAHRRGDRRPAGAGVRAWSTRSCRGDELIARGLRDRGPHHDPAADGRAG